MPLPLLLLAGAAVSATVSALGVKENLKYNKKFDSSICFATYSIPGMFQTNIASDNRAIWMHGEYLDILRK